MHVSSPCVFGRQLTETIHPQKFLSLVSMGLLALIVYYIVLGNFLIVN
jgi:hypothetical protein